MHAVFPTCRRDLEVDVLRAIGLPGGGDFMMELAASSPVEIDEDILKEIAVSTGGRYFRATDNNKLVEVYSEIDKLEKSKIDVRQFTRKQEEYLLLALIAFVLLALELLMRYTVLRKLT